MHMYMHMHMHMHTHTRTHAHTHTHTLSHTHVYAQNEQPNILKNAGTWGAHMGISANLRYQVLGGLDAVGGVLSHEGGGSVRG